MFLLFSFSGFRWLGFVRDEALVGDLPTPEARHRRWAHADVSVTGATSAAIVSAVRFRQLTGGTLCQASYSWPEEVTENVA